MITHLLYRSHSKGDVEGKQIDRILEKSHVNNLRDDITGLLLYRNKTFLQLLEGPQEAVTKCLARIRLDPRHYGTGIILQVQSETRIFPNWQMGHIPEAKILKPFDTVEELAAAIAKTGKQDRSTILALIRSFVAVESVD